jgi:hypothetical protein
MTVSPPGLISLVSAAIMRKVLCIQSDWGEARASTVMIFGKSVISLLRSGIVELKQPANYRCAFTVSPKS